jgi:hypothetical protein
MRVNVRSQYGRLRGASTQLVRVRCEIELELAPKGSTAPAFLTQSTASASRVVSTDAAKTLAPDRESCGQLPSIRATTTEISQDEIFVM